MSSNDEKIIVEVTREDLENLLCKELDSNIKVENFTSKSLTKPGDNYGSTILAVEVFYHKDGTTETHKLPIVAKLVPESLFLRQLFDIETTFNKEVRAYTFVAPEFYKLQKEKMFSENEILNVFSKYFGSRSNKQDDINMKADESAVLLMENLKFSGYEIRERRKGLNLKHMEFSIMKLAHFHALAVALKLLKPQVFKEKILKTCEGFEIGKSHDEREIEKSISNTLQFVKDVPECVPYIERIGNALHTDIKMRKEKTEPPPREPFATIVHNDFWVNNMMFKYDKSVNEIDDDKDHEAPTAMKFVDFQVTIYESPVRDLIFFLFTSSEDGLIEKHFDDLIKLYHKTFVEILTKLDCDTQPFSYQHFQEEMNAVLPSEFPHILYLLNPICADSEGMEEQSNVTRDSMFKKRGGDVYKKRVSCFVQKFINNGWL